MNKTKARPWVWRDDPVFPRSGVRLRLGASAYPDLWDARAFGEVDGSLSAYWTPPLGDALTLAARVGGKKLRGHLAKLLGL